MKPLVWTFCFGRSEAHRSMCRLYVRTLRQVARYSGPIIVFKAPGDAPICDPADNAEEIEAPWWEVKPGWRNMLFKLTVADHFDFSEFDQVLGGDCDILALGDIAPAFEGEAVVRAMVTRGRRYRMRRGSPFRGQLTKADKVAAGNRNGINAGLYKIPGPMMREVCQVWRETFESGGFSRGVKRHEQHAWNRIILREEIPFEPWPGRLVAVPVSTFGGTGYTIDRPPAETALLHYAGRKTEIKMGAVYRLAMRRLGVAFGEANDQIHPPRESP